ncbi:exosortase C-terminal domain/associated protein EpsI [Oceanidesulfovibrio marinus]|uniref:EpsI family protein n=1 Tax=Oceanidesulfovibrio marinus TaxID=370038 RepID=A0A6P1ZC70_9BACT|nr:exosortase C-terminal domain/associated protein EpsI [Oceanidesulfovibrio marinus]QJT07972.1 EpsI family protein [Oceanidesulfovibrio marinus]TVM30584.1 EpsI family protein [Oceanidesulfovibrio marinus]
MTAFSRRPYLLSVLVLLPVVLFIHLHENVAVPQVRSFDEFPASLGDWRQAGSETFSAETLDILHPTAYLSRFYVGPNGERVHLYLGYHGKGGIHSPRNCLLGSGWFQESRTEKTVNNIDGSPIHLVETVLSKGNVRMLMLYWFQMRDKTMQSEYALKIQEIINSALYSRRDESFVRISVEFLDDAEGAQKAAYGFLKAFQPVTKMFVPR